MDDYLDESIFIKELDVTIRISYKLNFDAEKFCGYSKIFKGVPEKEEESFEIYMENYECGMDREKAMEKFNKLVEEVKTGKIDVTF
jgi:hypothetical protein